MKLKHWLKELICSPKFIPLYQSNRSIGLSKNRSIDRAKRGYGKPFGTGSDKLKLLGILLLITVFVSGCNGGTITGSIVYDFSLENTTELPDNNVCAAGIHALETTYCSGQIGGII